VVNMQSDNLRHGVRMKNGFWRAFVLRRLAVFALVATISILCVPLFAVQTAAIPTDNTPPILDLIDSEGRALRNDTVFDTDDMTIICLAMDDISEIEDVEYSIDGSSFKPTTMSSDIHRTSIDLNGLTDGEHSITVRATNNASLTAEKTVDFAIDVSVASSENLLMWNILGAIVAISGIAIALILIIRESEKEPRPVVPSFREGEMPPIL